MEPAARAGRCRARGVVVQFEGRYTTYVQQRIHSFLTTKIKFSAEFRAASTLKCDHSIEIMIHP